MEVEEKEVKNKIELKSWFEDDKLYVGEYVKHKINQLDEPEVLSQEWIDENEEQEEMYGSYGVPVHKLQNLLVPKKELPVIPKFVADTLEENTFADLPTAFEELFSANAEHYYGEDICNWIVANDELFARVWLDGFTVEEEQKYYVMNNDNRMMLVRMMDGKTITEADPFKLEDMYEVEKKSHRLTEQEIKDYDERYFAFAVKVEELE